MTLTPDQKARRANWIDGARQHQEMVAKYPAFNDSLAWIDGKIRDLDQQWHVQAMDNDALQQLRGQKQVLTEVRDHFKTLLNIDVVLETEKLSKMDTVGED